MTLTAGLRPLLGQGDVLLVVPPFAGIDRPSLGAHLLQACARAAGFAVDVFYANLEFAERIGERAYEAIAWAPTRSLVGERLFARAAYGAPRFGRNRASVQPTLDQVCAVAGMTAGELSEVEQATGSWATDMAQAISRAGYRLVGCSTTFEQTAASVALLDRVKRAAPATITALGGANCDGPMGEGLLSLGVAADFVFRGESEQAFVQFLEGLRAGRVPTSRVVAGEPCRDLDALPTPDFTQFFGQVDAFAARPDGRRGLWLTHETSRGCWWGEKQHCTFCGLNAEGMASRRKSADRVIAEFGLLRERHGAHPVCLTDNIMPHEYFHTLLPRLGRELPGLLLFYEVKANLSLAQVRALVAAGVRIAQAGIEALSTRLLARMRKGVTARQNLALLRRARACALELRWNLLHGVPGDTAEDYEDQLALIPLLRHLEPPLGVFPVTIDRFSPYHFAPAQFGIRALRPLPSYRDVLPPAANAAAIAYHFDAEFDSGSRSNPELIHRLRDSVADWESAWQDGSRPVLTVVSLGEERFLLLDSRGLPGCATAQVLDGHRAAATLVSLPLPRSGEGERWARQQRLAVEVDGWHVGLATAEPGLLETFERPAPGDLTVRSGPR